jgi:F-type H+-transporting ATPase subunit delta
LKTAAEIVADPRVAAFTKDPTWSAADLVSSITEAAGDKLNAGMQNFVRVLAENHRLLLLPEIAAHYEAFRSEVENTIDVDVVSAVALNSAQAEKLKAALAKRLKRSVRMQNSVDPGLLGGAVVRAGDLVIDGSLKGRLQRLATELGS